MNELEYSDKLSDGTMNPINFMMINVFNEEEGESIQMSATSLQQIAKQKFFQDLKLKSEKQFLVNGVYSKKWYNTKTQKYRLGRISHAMILPNTPCLVRVIDMARISAYVVEKFQNKMVQLY
jgi:hypothetical protein